MSNKILLCGNPNVGKSSIFNMLTNSHEHTGNWTGKTVKLASKKITGTNYILVDLPGIYSLSSLSEEEVVAKNTLLFEDYKKIIYVIDGSNLEKNLNLFFQILQINKNIVLCINMIDELESKKINLDIDKLGKLLNIKVIKCSTYKNIGKDEILKSLDEDNYCDFNYYYNSETEGKIKEISSILPSGFNNRYISISMICKDKRLVNDIKDRYGINIETKEINNYLMNINGEDISDEISIKINKLCKIISREVFKREEVKKISLLDNIFSNKILTVIMMCIIMFGIFFITIVLANYPSDLLSNLFNKIENILYSFSINKNIPKIIYEPLIFGIYRVVTFIISVMFPPLVIFFILFTYAEEVGILPRIAFNMDRLCKISGCHGKQCLTMCSAFGCNACAVVGARIIDSKRDKIIAILTNSFIPCNGRFPMLIALITIFFTNSGNKLLVSLYLCLFILFSISISFLISFILSKTILKGYPGFFVLELPEYKKVKLSKILKNSIIYKSLSILKKAIIVSIPAGLLIWLLTNTYIGNNSIFIVLAKILNPFSKLIGLDGIILLSFLLALPANEIVLPIIVMGYLKASNVSLLSDYTSIKNILIANGWTVSTAISVILFSIMHFPCGTTLLTIKNEIGTKWMIYSFLIPLVTGIIFLFIINIVI